MAWAEPATERTGFTERHATQMGTHADHHQPVFLALACRAGDIGRLRIGKARIAREGSDVTIVSYSIGVGVALEAAKALADEGIEAEVVDLRTLRPLDRSTVLASLKKTNRMVVVEEGWPQCSIASEIMAIAMEDGFDDLDAPVLRVTNEDVPLPYAANLEKAALVKAADVVAAAKRVTYKD